MVLQFELIDDNKESDEVEQRVEVLHLIVAVDKAEDRDVKDACLGSESFFWSESIRTVRQYGAAGELQDVQLREGEKDIPEVGDREGGLITKAELACYESGQGEACEELGKLRKRSFGTSRRNGVKEVISSGREPGVTDQRTALR